jgi:GNAT superfamily N-acetyltransferase
MQYNLEANPEILAITCFVIRPEYRNKGLAAYILKVILEDLKSRGVKMVQAFPKRTDSDKPGEHWKGPESMYVSMGFTIERDDPNNPILSLRL